jgi:hypothetical protein
MTPFKGDPVRIFGSIVLTSVNAIRDIDERYRAARFGDPERDERRARAIYRKRAPCILSEDADECDSDAEEGVGAVQAIVDDEAGQRINRAIRRWAMRNFKRLRGHELRAREWVERVAHPWAPSDCHDNATCERFNAILAFELLQRVASRSCSSCERQTGDGE